MKKNILITGCSGFIGSELVKKLLRKNVYLYLLINKEKPKIRSKKIKFIYCSLLNYSKLKKKLYTINITDIIHCAWIGVSSQSRNSLQQNQKKIIGFAQQNTDQNFIKYMKTLKKDPKLNMEKLKLKFLKKCKYFAKKIILDLFG